MKRKAAHSPRRETNSLRLAELRAGLKPFRLHWFSRLRSTNDTAAELRRRGDLFAPAVVVASNQTAGRGRGGNTWWSGPGCLTATFAFPIEEHLAPHQLPLVAGLAVRNAVAELCGDQSVGLKWPNDVVHDGRKLAGLLCERIHRVDLIGVGLNVNLKPSDAPRQLRGRITSLRDVRGAIFDHTDVLLRVAQSLLRTLQRRNESLFAALLHEYDRYHVLIGRRVAVSMNGAEPPVVGRCQGIDDQGRLILRERKRTHRIIAGHVEML
jgi:BirA family biotin operon repressor/biotin-[acetyl-CoA-carboxylase] ligase